MIEEVAKVAPGQIWQDLGQRSGKPLCKVRIVKAGKAFMQRCRQDGTVIAEAPITALVQEMLTPAWQLVRDN